MPSIYEPHIHTVLRQHKNLLLVVIAAVAIAAYVIPFDSIMQLIPLTQINEQSVENIGNAGTTMNLPRNLRTFDSSEDEFDDVDQSNDQGTKKAAEFDDVDQSNDQGTKKAAEFDDVDQSNDQGLV